MKTLKKVPYIPVFLPAELPPKEELEQGKVYISEKYETSVHLCLCGCGNLTVLPLTNDMWKLIKLDKNTVSFVPSVGNYNFPCRSHYIMTLNVANFV